MRTIQEDFQERSNSVVSRDRNLRSIPKSEDSAFEAVNNENRSPNRKHQRSAPYPATYRSSQRKKGLQSPAHLSSISPHTQKSHVTSQVAQINEEVLDPFDELCHAKLSLMAEKTANRFIMKELLTQVSLINDLFYRK